MSHKGKRAQMKAFSAYMETEGVQSDVAIDVVHGMDQPGQTSMLVENIKNTIIQEFGKTEVEFHKFKSEICKSLEAIDWKFDTRLTSIKQKKNRYFGKGSAGF